VRQRLRMITLMISAVTCVLFSAIWIRSVWTTDWIGYCGFLSDNPEIASFSVNSMIGVLDIDQERTEFWAQHGKLATDGGRHWEWITTPAEQFELPWTQMSWKAYWFQFSNTNRSIYLRIPYWFIVLLSAIYPAVYLVGIIIRRRQRSKRIANGLCANCGYDLQSKDGRCPECGTEQPSAANAPKPANL
jgi:hypothetical protein